MKTTASSEIFITVLYNRLAMGQADVLEILRNSRSEWSTSKDICKKVDVSMSSVLLALKKLRQQGFVERRRKPDDRYGFQYRFKSGS